MKVLDWKGRILFIIAIIGLSLGSCKVTDEPETNSERYIVSHSFLAQVTVDEIKFKLAWAKAVFPDVGPFADLIKTDIDVEKVVYKTTFMNRSINASGLVYMPKLAGNYPVLCFQNGTNTQYSMAPSMNSDDGVLSILESVAAMGFIVVVPDYIGFGESSQYPHPFLHAQSLVQSTLDMLRAVREYSTEDKNTVKSTSDLFIFGYSLGGWATMQLQKEIETKYASEFNLKASSCAAGPYSLEYMTQYITGLSDYSNPYFLAYLLKSYTTLDVVPNPMSDFAKEPYATRIPGLFDGKHSGASINSSLTTKIADLLTDDFRTQYQSGARFASFSKALTDNSVNVSNWMISTPTKLFHGSTDEVVPASMSEKIIHDMKAAGNPDSKVQLVIIPGVGHTDGVMPVGIATIQWFLQLKK